jgi:carboxynorspermidine decarboxylase
MREQILKNSVNTPAFVIDKAVLQANLKQLVNLREQCGVKVLYSIKALPLSAVLDVAKNAVDGFAVSSLFEARLAREFLPQGELHFTSPCLKAEEVRELDALCSHLHFNSLSQQQQFAALFESAATGLRINPKLSFASDTRFDPCRAHSKLGVSIDELWQRSDLTGVQGLHFHTVFGSTDFTPLLKTLAKLRDFFGKNLAKLRWLNLGGGYLFNQIANHQPFIQAVRQLKTDFDLDVYIEPASAVVNSAAHLVVSVVDSFISDGKTVLIVDSSVNHLPRLFEFQLSADLVEHDDNGTHAVMIAGCSCLAGDVFGEYRLRDAPAIGDKLIFQNVGAYSLVKAQRFNGHNLPTLYVDDADGVEWVKQYSYADFRQQWL